MSSYYSNSKKTKTSSNPILQTTHTDFETDPTPNNYLKENSLPHLNHQSFRHFINTFKSNPLTPIRPLTPRSVFLTSSFSIKQRCLEATTLTPPSSGPSSASSTCSSSPDFSGRIHAAAPLYTGQPFFGSPHPYYGPSGADKFSGLQPSDFPAPAAVKVAVKSESGASEEQAAKAKHHGGLAGLSKQHSMYLDHKQQQQRTNMFITPSLMSIEGKQSLQVVS